MPAISGLNAAVAVNDADEVAIIQGGETKRLSADKLSGLKAIGEGQAWQDMAGQRALGVVYTNATGKPVMVSVTNQAESAGAQAVTYCEVDGVRICDTLANADAGTIGRVSENFIVPNGSTYKVTGGAGDVLYAWKELR